MLFSFLLASATDCVPAQLTSAVLLNVLHFNSIPSGCDHSTAETAKVPGVHGKGSPLFCLFHNNNNGVRGAERPTQLLRLTYTTTLQSLSLPLTLSLAPSPIHRATCRASSLNTPINVRGDEVVGVQLQRSGAGDNRSLQFSAVFKDHKAAH